MSHEDATEFCRRLSDQEGKTYRLLTGAEWEYACRAGTTTTYHFGDSDGPLGVYAWFEDNAWDVDEKYAHEFGKKRANPFGLYDMQGNALERCSDRYGENLPGARIRQVRSQAPSG